jgi:hypothetical protein
MRKAIAAAMRRSKREIPHYYLTDSVDLSRAVRSRASVPAFRAPAPAVRLPARRDYSVRSTLAGRVGQFVCCNSYPLPVTGGGFLSADVREVDRDFSLAHNWGHRHRGPQVESSWHRSKVKRDRRRALICLNA